MSKYGKLVLSAYIMKKMKPGRYPSEGILRKYAKLALGAYLLNKLKSEKPEKEVEVEVEPEEEIPEEEIMLPVEAEEGGRSLMRIGEITLGVLAGATIIYALKKYAAKKSGYRIDVE